MKTKKYFIFLLTLLCMMVLNVSAVFASSLEDLSNGQTVNSTTEQPESAVADYLRGREAVTAENMQEAQTYVSPITNIIGTLIGVILAITSSAIFLVTALDLLYIGVPFVRPLLYPAGQQAGGAPMGGMPMGGMGRMGMGGGMAMGGMQGAQAMASGNSRRFVSDEAIAAVALAQPVSAQAPMMGGGMGMGGMGMGMGGMPMGGGAPAQQSTKSVIMEYLKKRTIFIIIFAVCSVVLFSSILTDCGINIGLLFLKLIGKVSDAATTVNM